MLINTDAIVSMREANQNFSRVAKMVEAQGAVVIMKNNKPCYVLMPYHDVEEAAESPSDELIDKMVEQFADHYALALEELAK